MENSDRLGLRCTFGLELRRRCIFEVRHVLWRLAIQRVESHIQRVPRPGQLEAGISRGMRVVGDRHFVIEPPTELAVPAEKVVNQALNDLAKRSLPARYGILERVVPLRPGILLGAPGASLDRLRPPRESRGDPGSQARVRPGNRSFTLILPPVIGLGPEHSRNFRRIASTILTG